MSLYPSLISSTERNILDGLTTSTVELNYLDITTLGTAEASKALTVASTKGLVWTTTSAVTWNPFQMTNTMTQAGNTGGRMLIEMATNVTLGGWAQAIKAYTNFGAAGAVTGLASAINAEMQVGAQCSITGTYAPLETELVIASGGAGGGTKTGFWYANVTGVDLASFNSNGYLFILGTGITDTSGGLFDANSKSAINMTHAIQVNINGVDYFIPLHTSIDFGV